MRKQGFTLIELMLVVVIIGILASMVMPKLVGKSEQAKKSVSQADIEANISSALELYEIDNGKFPTTEQGLSALRSKPYRRSRAEKLERAVYKKRRQGSLG